MNASLQSITVPINKFFGRHHPTIFITVVSLLLIAALAMLITIISASTVPDAAKNSTNQINGTFDETTIKRINELKDSRQNPAALSFPQGDRTNPFVE